MATAHLNPLSSCRFHPSLALPQGPYSIRWPNQVWVPPMVSPTSTGINTVLMWGQEQRRGSEVSKDPKQSPSQAGSPFPLVLGSSLFSPPAPEANPASSSQPGHTERPGSTAGGALLSAPSTRARWQEGAGGCRDTLNAFDRRRPGRSHGRELQVPWASSRKRGRRADT